MSGEYFIAEDRGGELWVRAADVQSTISTLQAERDALRKAIESAPIAMYHPTSGQPMYFAIKAAIAVKGAQS